MSQTAQPKQKLQIRAIKISPGFIANVSVCCDKASVVVREDSAIWRIITSSLVRGSSTVPPVSVPR